MADLSIFLPKTIINLVRKRDVPNPWRVEEGTILFCDVAGFTPLTETLSKMGKEGAEQLTLILNRYFSAMIEIVYKKSGDVVRFGGDAMTLFFAAGLEESAVSCALEMMLKMRDFKEIKAGGVSFSLEMKIGAAHG